MMAMEANVISKLSHWNIIYWLYVIIPSILKAVMCVLSLLECAVINRARSILLKIIDLVQATCGRCFVFYFTKMHILDH